MKTVTTPQALQITRQIHAPRERVFAAFSSLEAMQPWFGPGSDCQIRGEVDFRPGGRYRMILNCPDMENPQVRAEYTVAGVYREIHSPEKIVFTWTWEGDPDWIGIESTVTVECRESGAGTELRLTHSGFPSEPSQGRHEHGWNGSLEKLVASLG
ncbi:MAG: SRPBCC domain-containing protein [Candidatus Methylacidiphilales bacterium]|nr:SRPBCC domain-containing protein [Candidatus Methylacidiphilales bacterium]